MKTLLNTIALIAGLQLTAAAATITTPTNDDPQTHKLTIRVDNVKLRQGTVNVAIYTAETSATGSAYRKARLVIPASGEIEVNFDELPAGQYAVRMFQDVNSNLKLDYKGPMPSEPFGFSNSNSPMASFTFEKNSFPVDTDKTVTVTLVAFE
jgi:uncharacterized protein (DUF2141 family)